MKKFILSVLVFFAVLSVAFAGGQKEPSNSTGGIKTVKAGVLTVATSPDFAPYEFYAIDENGKPSLAGFDIFLAQYIADYLGLKLEIIPMDFDGTLMELQMKNVDLSLAGYSPDPAREESMDFSILYYTGGQAFVSLGTRASEFTKLEDLNNPKLKVGAQIGSIQMNLAKEFSKDADIVELSKVTDIIAEIITGKLDGAYIEAPVAATYAKSYPQLQICLSVPYDQEGSAVGVSKGNQALLDGVNAAITQALADGSMDSFVAKANELAGGNIIEGLLEN